jgi:phage terminase Nu1 subunit (DNA packaging protein)
MSLTNWQKEGFPVAKHRSGRGGSKVSIRDAIEWYCRRRVAKELAWAKRQLQEAKAKPSSREIERISLIQARRIKIELETVALADKLFRLGGVEESAGVAPMLGRVVAELQAINGCRRPDPPTFFS